MREPFVHPYMPNSVPHIQQEMLHELGVGSIEELYRDTIPPELRFEGLLDLPRPIRSEAELSRHVNGLLRQNRSCEDAISFLGAGCYRHWVPALCDEIGNRAEFLTAYCGDTYSDHGKMQAIFEYTSMMGELLDLDVVSYPCYDAGQALSSALRMALRLRPGRTQLLIPSTMNPQILSQAKNYCQGFGELVPVAADPQTGHMDLADLKAKLGPQTAGVFFENPSFLGFFEENAETITRLTHEAGAVSIVMPEVASLGVMAPPAQYGADITCGEIQPLGTHMQMGGGCGGFLATRQEEEYILQFPTYLYGILDTDKPGRYGWGRSLNFRCSHGSRENANEYFGTESGLWAIVAGVYLASMGPQGMAELGETILQRTAWAVSTLREKLAGLPVRVHPFGGSLFQEFVLDFTPSGKTVEEINRQLREYNIFGGWDLSHDFPQYGQSALYAITELTQPEDILALADALTAILGGDVK